MGPDDEGISMPGSGQTELSGHTRGRGRREVTGSASSSKDHKENLKEERNENKEGQSEGACRLSLRVSGPANGTARIGSLKQM